MTKFKADDSVVYIFRGRRVQYAKVIEVKEVGNQMWVEWHNESHIKRQLIDCDNFELVNKGREDE